MLLSTGEQVSVALMAMAVHSLGAKAVSLTGGQMGIRTDNSYTKARIRSIDTARIRKLLNEGNIVIAAGFQGMDEDLNITTLGRGGSDTTAVALAAVLGADACEIYTDVDGVYTCDPRQLPEARRVEIISYDEMLELASLGAGVMHNRSIEFAKKFGVPIHVRSSFTDIPGTMIVAESESDSAAVGGAAMTRNEARVTILGLPDVPGSSLELFSHIASRKITVDMIVQNIGSQGRADVSFTVPSSELKATLDAATAAAAHVGAQGVTHDPDVSKVSVVGLGMSQQAGVAHRMFQALAEADINIQMITTSEIKISVSVPRSQSLNALRAVHQTFALHEQPSDAKTWNQVRTDRQKTTDVEQLISRLVEDELEQLTLTGISLDPSQARITLAGIPDAPGVAADVFYAVGQAGIFVDMIVQGYDGNEGSASITFTVQRTDLIKALDVSKKLAVRHGVASISSQGEIAKLTVSGIGLRSHTSVGSIMFKTLADAGINVQMINTSELQVNVVVDGECGNAALDALRQAFANNLR